MYRKGLVNLELRLLPFVFLCFLPSMILVFLFLFYGPLFFAPLGTSKDDGFLLSIFPMWSTIMSFPVLWEHFAMRLSFPPLGEVFLHPKSLTKEWLGKFIIVFFAFIALKFLLSYLDNPFAFIVSIGIIMDSLYAIIVEFEIFRHFAKYMSLMNPLKRIDEL